MYHYFAMHDTQMCVTCFEKGIDLVAPPVLSLKTAITAMMPAQGAFVLGSFSLIAQCQQLARRD
jgi:hypothetical protein